MLTVLLTGRPSGAYDLNAGSFTNRSRLTALSETNFPLKQFTADYETPFVHHHPAQVYQLISAHPVPVLQAIEPL